MRLLPAEEGLEPVVAVRRLTSEEAALEEVHVHPDLTALEELALVDALALGPGREAVFDHDIEPCALVGPHGWLGPAVAAGDVVVLRWDGASLHVTCGPEEPAFDEVAAARLGRLLAAAFVADQAEPFEHDVDDDEEGGHIEFSGIADLVYAVDEEHPGVFASVVPPLSELLVEAGLEIHDELVGRPGTNWETLEQVDDVIAEMAARRAQFVRGRAALQAVDVLLDAFDAAIPPAAEARELAALLAVEPGVAPAFADETITHGEQLHAVEAFAHQLLESSRGGTAAAGAAWLLGALAEEQGDFAAQDRWLHRSLAADRSYPPALVDSSWYASDRGDASRAASLLAAVGVGDDDHWYQRLVSFAAAGPLTAGRNDPCPCGSGRKHKACCARANGWPLPARASWLYDKAAAYLDRPYATAALTDLYEVEGLDEYYRMDLALFEGGVLEEFVEARGALLPEDERALAASWIGRRRRVFEVVEVRPGEALTVEDVLTGVTTVLKERAGSRTVQPHQLLNARLLPAGDGTTAIFGPVLIVRPGTERELAAQLEAGTARDLGQWWVESVRPPTMTTKDGEPLAVARAVYDVADPAALEEVARLSPEAGSIDVHGSRISLQATAESSLVDLETLVVATAPSARLVDRSVIPLTGELARRVRGRRVRSDDGDGFADSPEAAEVLAAFVREREEQWVDEPIPALGGRTPRDACADESGRREVLRLLAGFGPTGPGAMDPGRLRSLLGL